MSLLLAVPALAATDVYIKLAGSASAKLTIALPPFAAEQVTSAEDALAAHQLRSIVRDDLLFSRYFDVKENSGADPGSGWLLTVKAGQAAGRVTMAAKLVNRNGDEIVFERFYKQDSRFIRTIAHRLSDDVVLALTGKAGIAGTRIAFAGGQGQDREIFAVDYDGANLRQLTDDDSISLLPRFSPDGKKLAYTGYKNGNPDLFLLDLERGGSAVASQEQGLNIAGGFSPDGTMLLMTLSRQKAPNIYLKNFSDGSVTQLTQHYGADSSPTFSPDAGHVAFVSDRSGNPQIYVLDMATRRAQRLTNLNWCDSPAWSPTGEWIAASCRANQKDKMDIFLVDVTGTQVRQLTRGEGSNENPAWSPDGRFLAFSSTRDGPSPRLYVMDADGSAPHRVAGTASGSVTPNWSN